MKAKTRVRFGNRLEYIHEFEFLRTPRWCYVLADNAIGTTSA